MAEGEDNTLTMSLMHVGLEGEYWLSVLKSKFGIVNIQSTKHLDTNILEELKKCARSDHEVSALEEFLSGSELSDASDKRKNSGAQQEQNETEESTSGLKSLQNTGNSSLLTKGPITSIPALLSAIKFEMIPAYQFGHEQGQTDKSDSSKIDRQASIELASAVDHFRIYLEKGGMNFHLFYLITNLHQIFYNPTERKFENLLTLDRLTSFVEEMQKNWDAYQSYEKVGPTELQAFLVHLLLTTFPFSDQPQQKEKQFTDALQEVHSLMTPHIKQILETFTKTSPFQWQELQITLQQLKEGNFDVLQQIEVNKDLQHILTNAGSEYTPATEETEGPDQNAQAGNILEILGLSNCFPPGISLQDVMTIGKLNRSDYQTHNLPWIILRTLIMIDYNGRDCEINKVLSAVHVSNQYEIGEGDLLDDILGDVPDRDSVTLNPLDVFVAIFSCCDLMLRQTLAQKMFMCRLAVPFIWPQIPSGTLIYSLWALRTIVVEWRDANQKASETSVANYPFKIVSFVRFGRPFLSKSKLLNNILSDQGHNTFWNSDCPLGYTDRSVSDGLVEAAWFLPAGKDTDTLKGVTTFLNLRGDAEKHDKQIQILRTISNVVVVCLDVNVVKNSTILETMKSIHENSPKVVLLPLTNEAKPLPQQRLRSLLNEYITYVGNPNMKNTKITGLKQGKEMNADDMKKEIRKVIAESIEDQVGKSMEDVKIIAENAGVRVDEMDDGCQKGKQFAEEVLAFMRGKSTNQCKKEMLPFQGDKWQEWSRLLKKKQRSGGKNMESSLLHEKDKIKQRMNFLRREQLNECKSSLLKMFIFRLTESVDTPIVLFFMQWLKLYLDDKSREILPGLSNSYHENWAKYKKAKNTEKHDSGQLDKLKRDVDTAEILLAEASLGLENLFREVAQIYESAVESNIKLKSANMQNLRKLPKAAAKLLLKGHCMEIMDGDASNVPLTWITAVFDSLKNLVGDKKIFVLSVLGIQSSGKSTLLNTMFGLQFSVSAGRCTRGVYMQLLKVDNKSISVPYDFVMVVDTEGLRAPELGQMKHDHDNELATFVIGLADVTIINIKGENVAEVKDVLQIAVHAFLRMKLVNKKIHHHRSCIFIHQNVPALNAKEKMRHGCQKLQDNLDEMTLEACAIENIADIQSFKQVIDFDGTKHVWYFSDLWHGDPPMAPANPGYSAKVQEVKHCLLDDLSKNQKTFLNFSDMMLRVRDLWKGVLADDFVFSFRNSLAAKAYSSLENKYYELMWPLEDVIMNWVNKEATIQMQQCTSSQKLEECHAKLLNILEKEINMNLEMVSKQLENFFEDNHLKDILIQWKNEKFISLNSDAAELKTRARTDLLQLKESLRLDLLKKTSQERHEAKIMQRATEFADEMKGKATSDDNLQDAFSSMWRICLNELNLGASIIPKPIHEDVEQAMWTRLSKDSVPLRNELDKNPLATKLTGQTLKCIIRAEDIEETHLSVHKSFKQWITRADVWHHCRGSATRVINSILHEVDVYLTDLKTGNLKYQQSHAIHVIMTIIDHIEKHNQQKSERYSFNILPNLKVKTVVLACRYAAKVFTKMQEEYDKKNSPAAKLEEYKTTVWNLFKNTVKQSTQEVIVADMLCDRMAELMKKSVKKAMPRKVLGRIFCHLGLVKYSLIVAILDDLAVKGDFYLFCCFITNAKNYALEWVTSHTNRNLLSLTNNKLSEYAQMVSTCIEEIISCMEKSIRATTSYVLGCCNSTMKTWLEKFSLEMQKEMAVPESDMKCLMEHHVKDFTNLQRLLLDRLQNLKEQVFHHFKVDTAANIKWEGTTPYKMFIDKVWGCEAQCPFCNEPCQRRDTDHENHSCIQHRPTGVSGIRWECRDESKHGSLVVESCAYEVQSDSRFNCSASKYECRESGMCTTTGSDGVYHSYRKYKTFLPKWDIAPDPDMSSSKYWMWFMATYQHKLSDMYNAKLPIIPSTWNDITQEEAKHSLRESHQIS